MPPVYDRAALKLTEAERGALIAQGKKPHWRFKLEHRDVVWDDVVQGRKSFPAASLSDPVLVREDGVPLYTFCSVVDDADFSVTHVIRGEDHVTNTAVQIEIWQADHDQTPPPQFAHFPLIVSASGIEMSKRLGTLSIASLRDEMEIEPIAITSLLAKLGTSDPIMPRRSLNELVVDFDLGKISRATPKFDIEELKALNAKILHLTPYEDVRATGFRRWGLSDVSAEDFWNAVRTNLGEVKRYQTMVAGGARTDHAGCHGPRICQRRRQRPAADAVGPEHLEPVDRRRQKQNRAQGQGPVYAVAPRAYRLRSRTRDEAALADDRPQTRRRSVGGQGGISAFRRPSPGTRKMHSSASS